LAANACNGGEKIMSVSEKVSTTMLWVKQFSTKTFSAITKKLFSIQFINRNKKSILICLVSWLIVNLVVFFIYRNSTTGLKNDFYQKAIAATQSLSAKTGPSLLGKDVLSLNVAIGEFAKKENVVFVAILDHQNRVVAHSDPKMTNRPLMSLQDLKQIKIIDGVSVETGKAEDGNKPLFRFSQDISYSGVKIGKVYYVVSPTELIRALSRSRMIFLSVLFLSTILVAVILFIVDRIFREKARKIREEVEGMVKIGPYVLTKKIAKGGMAELFIADYIREDGFRRTVAIKKILPHLSENKDFIRMFIREARLAALLQHPNIVQIIDFGKIQNAYLIAMEYIPGRNLAEIMAHLKQGLPLDLSIFIIMKICMGLAYSHTRKDDRSSQPLRIVHRDISPQNMLISFLGEVKIADFGISKARSEPSLTQAGVIKGKLSYLSPEQVLGQEVDHQADIYALGLVFYEILTYKKVYRFDTHIDAIRSIPIQEIPPLISLRPDIPHELSRIVTKCLEKDKQLRYQSAQEIHDDLMRLRNKLNITCDASNLSDFMRKNFSQDEKTAQQE
jgi:eukaryotic-like serine/threonine-protein kinase